MVFVLMLAPSVTTRRGGGKRLRPEPACALRLRGRRLAARAGMIAGRLLVEPVVQLLDPLLPLGRAWPVVAPGPAASPASAPRESAEEQEEPDEEQGEEQEPEPPALAAVHHVD